MSAAQNHRPRHLDQRRVSAAFVGMDMPDNAWLWADQPAFDTLPRHAGHHGAEPADSACPLDRVIASAPGDPVHATRAGS
jgi:hypothetical protein